MAGYRARSYPPTQNVAFLSRVIDLRLRDRELIKLNAADKRQLLWITRDESEIVTTYERIDRRSYSAPVPEGPPTWILFIFKYRARYPASDVCTYM